MAIIGNIPNIFRQTQMGCTWGPFMEHALDWWTYEPATSGWRWAGMRTLSRYVGSNSNIKKTWERRRKHSLSIIEHYWAKCLHCHEGDSGAGSLQPESHMHEGVPHLQNDFCWLDIYTTQLQVVYIFPNHVRQIWRIIWYNIYIYIYLSIYVHLICIKWYIKIIHRIHGDGSKPCTPGEHKNSW